MVRTEAGGMRSHHWIPAGVIVTTVMLASVEIQAQKPSAEVKRPGHRGSRGRSSEARELMPGQVAYQGPLALWYGIALGPAWLAYLAGRDCTDIGCTGVVILGIGPRVALSPAPAIVHWNRRRVGRGFLSLGGQIGAAALGAAAGEALLPERACENPGGDELDGCHLPRAFDGWLIADILWATTDVLLTPGTIPENEPRGITLPVPSIAWDSRGARLVLSGTF